MACHLCSSHHPPISAADTLPRPAPSAIQYQALPALAGTGLALAYQSLPYLPNHCTHELCKSSCTKPGLSLPILVGSALPPPSCLIIHRPPLLTVPWISTTAMKLSWIALPNLRFRSMADYPCPAKPEPTLTRLPRHF